MTQAPEKMTARLRQLMASPGMIRAINVYDPLTARIAESVGFQASSRLLKNSRRNCPEKGVAEIK